MAREREDPTLSYWRRQIDLQERELAAMDRQRAVRMLREAFSAYMAAFLDRRREFATDLSDERRDEIRDEYRKSHGRVRQAYRPARDLFAEFLVEEPDYDLRREIYESGGYDLPLDYPFTQWWSALTFDEAYGRWSNADDDHISRYMRRQEAVLDAFEDWARLERDLPREAGHGAAETPAGPDSAGSARDRRALARVLNHPWVITVGGGVIVILMAGLALKFT
jgi:hypothetical protein